MQIAGELVRSAVEAFLSAQEETIFGNLMEGFAVFIVQHQYRGKKSSYRNVDLEFERDGTYFIVGIKSGVHWGNFDQINAMRRNFAAARVSLVEQGMSLPVVAVNGCIYGRDARFYGKSDVASERDDSYYKYAGQSFWEFLTGDDALYHEIIEPIGKAAYERDRNFQALYTARVNQMTIEFGQKFVHEGQINWRALVDHVSKRP
jgi:hypothetical protein